MVGVDMVVHTRSVALWLGPLLALGVAAAFVGEGYGSDIAIVGFVAVLCVIWWVFEPVPIPVTSLLPLAILPLFGVLTPAEVGQASRGACAIAMLRGSRAA